VVVKQDNFRTNFSLVFLNHRIGKGFSEIGDIETLCKTGMLNFEGNNELTLIMRLFSKTIIFLGLSALSERAEAQASNIIIDHAIYYDGYAKLVNDTLPNGQLRLRNDLITTKLTEAQLQQVYDDLTIKITIGALCDNYDRIADVNLAMVPKGSSNYIPDSVQRLEIGRFITPFMNKNKDPKSVEYVFKADNLAKVLRMPSLLENYDFWFELEVFGVPYAAQKEVQGCSDRNDVFEGKVEFISQRQLSIVSEATYFKPIVFKHLLNNYEEGKTDTLGKTVKTFEVNIEADITNATFYLITSNHGANENGEEYIRRKHVVFLDGNQVLTYVPGGKSCEPYRIHNTQGNGIYGKTPEPDSSWLSWNNWCPGDTISVREISVRNLKAGNHLFTISVPDAQFAEKQGYFPVSVYLQGVIDSPEKKSKKVKKFRKKTA